MSDQQMSGDRAQKGTQHRTECPQLPEALRTNSITAANLTLRPRPTTWSGYRNRRFSHSVSEDDKQMGSQETHHSHSITGKDIRNAQHCVIGHVGQDVDECHNWHRNPNGQGQISVRTNETGLPGTNLSLRVRATQEFPGLWIFEADSPSPHGLRAGCVPSPGLFLLRERGRKPLLCEDDSG